MYYNMLPMLYAERLGSVFAVRSMTASGSRRCDGFMKRSCAATVWREGNWYVSQCLEVGVASQGESEEEALANLKQALELHFEPPRATRPPQMFRVEIEV